MNYFDNLDNDIIFEILKNLFSLELKSSSVINKNFNSIIREYWNDFTFNIYYTKYRFDKKFIFRLLKYKSIMFSLKTEFST